MAYSYAERGGRVPYRSELTLKAKNAFVSIRTYRWRLKKYLGNSVRTTNSAVFQTVENFFDYLFPLLSSLSFVDRITRSSNGDQAGHWDESGVTSGCPYEQDPTECLCPSFFVCSPVQLFRRVQRALISSVNSA